MTPRRARIYASLLLVLGASVAANVLLLQPRPGQRGPLVAQLEGAGKEAPGATQGSSAVSRSDKITVSSRQDPSAETIRAIQRELKEGGYYDGPSDGVANLSTHAAIMAYESDRGLKVTGAPADELLKMLILGTRIAARPAADGGVAKGSPAEQVTRLVQQQLTRRGYNIAAVDGRLGEDTRRAILAFEGEQRMPASGRISAPLLMKLQRSGTAGRLAGR